MRILMLVSSMTTGGAERVAATLCGAWAARGDQVTLAATFLGTRDSDYPLDARIRFVPIGERVRDRGGPAGRYLGKLAALRALVRECEPDVVVSFLTNVNITALMALWGCRVPVVACERSDPGVSTDTDALTRLLRRLLYPFASLVTVQTDSAVASLRGEVRWARRVAVVPNPVPEALLAHPIPAPAAVGRRRLVAVGRLGPEKRFSHLIDAFASLAARFPEVDLWIWGEGPLRAQLEAQAAATGLAHRIRLPGRTQDPWREMQAADVLALTSEYEGFPNAMLEAMALGVPCVAYDCPSGPRELSDDGRDARLVPSGDRQALEVAIATLLDDPAGARRSAADVARRVRARYATAPVLAAWDRAIEQARALRPAPFAERGG